MKKPNIPDENLCAAVLAENADIPELVRQHGYTPQHVIMIQMLLVDPNFTKIAKTCGFGRGTVAAWARTLRIPSQADKRAVIIYRLSGEHPNLRTIAEEAGIHVRRVWEVVALTGTQGQYYPSPKEDAMEEAIRANPNDSNREIADKMGPGFDRDSVARFRRKFDNRKDQLPRDMTIKNLFFDAAIEIVKKHLEKHDRPKLEQTRVRSKQPGWISLLEGKLPWPTSSGNFPGCHMPEYRFLDIALTLYLEEAGIKGADHLKSIVENGFFQFSGPLPIFQALHLVFAAREVSFDRLKIQNGYRQTWLPTRSQMIIRAKEAGACAR